MDVRTVGDLLYWSYANLAMAHAAVERGSPRYQTVHYMIRARLFKGLRAGTMDLGSLGDDERLKMVLPQACCYCGDRDHLSADHLVPRSRGGPNVGENLVWACRSCNSSKGAEDVLEWIERRGEFPPLLLLRRYLKLAVEYCDAEDLLDRSLNEVAQAGPFTLRAIPRQFPAPGDLVLWRVPLPLDLD